MTIVAKFLEGSVEERNDSRKGDDIDSLGNQLEEISLDLVYCHESGPLLLTQGSSGNKDRRSRMKSTSSRSSRQSEDMRQECKGADAAPVIMPSEVIQNRLRGIYVNPHVVEEVEDISQFEELSPTQLNDEMLAVALMENLMSGSVLVDNRTFSFPLFGRNGELLVNSSAEFITKLGCGIKSKAKVISIFGNAGDGKSYTLNHTFFGGEQIFKTSSGQSPCTHGVWATYDRNQEAVLLDTEGMMGMTTNHNLRNRLLLKVMAVSDVVIFKTKAERLNSDLFKFLGETSRAYMERYGGHLEKVCSRLKMEKENMNSLCPSLIIFHESSLTKEIDKGQLNFKVLDLAENCIRKKFVDMGLDSRAFSTINYVGKSADKHYSSLLPVVKKVLTNTKIRGFRKMGHIYRALELLTASFLGSLEQENSCPILDEFFSCRTQCLACGLACKHTTNHAKDNLPHVCRQKCVKSDTHQNFTLYCKACSRRGERVKVTPKMPPSNVGFFGSLTKMALSGYILDCPNCGQIYNSKKYWFGNQAPDVEAAEAVVHHVWPDCEKVMQDDHYTGRRLIDHIGQLGETLANVGAVPLEAVGVWAADRVAPAYWEPNSKPECSRCGKNFDYTNKRHHCRACGRCVCQPCSSRSRPVPEKGWGSSPVRVCDDCFTNTSPDYEYKMEITTTHLYPRKVSEYLSSTFDVLSSAVKYPLDAIKDVARPAYWVKDEQIVSCCVCSRKFNEPVPLLKSLEYPQYVTRRSEDAKPSVVLKVHHCRGCGRGVCDDCSVYLPVKCRGWEDPVRVCTKCSKRDDL